MERLVDAVDAVAGSVGQPGPDCDL
jgi:hypothetical protein